MRKFLTFLLLIALSLVLVACKEKDEEEKDTLKPVFYGIYNITIEEGDEFDPLDGVSAIDNVDGDITDRIQVIGKVDTSKPGTYLIEYVVKDSAGNEKRLYRQIKVDYKFAYGKTYNGDFEDGLNQWGSWFGEGGQGSVTVENGVVIYKVDAIGNQFWSTQFFQEKIGLEKGKTYKVTFKAKADVPRKMKIKVEPDPAYYEENFDLTTEYQEFTFTFSMSERETTENAKINLFLGKIEDDDPATTVYIDYIYLEEVTE